VFEIETCFRDGYDGDDHGFSDLENFSVRARWTAGWTNAETSPP
jgi:hypothetical protein